MNTEQIIKEYFKGLEAGSYNQVIQLFDEHAVIHSPLYGIVDAQSFYQELFKDTNRSRITLLNVFVSTTAPCAAAHFLYDWVLKDGTPTDFECVDVFEFNPKTNKITSLKIIYDTFKVRPVFTEAK